MDSDSDRDEAAPKAKRQKRFRFKTFEQRVAEVDVDVYRSLGPKRAEPLPGNTSFFQEALNKWRELCSAEHWLAAAAALTPLSQSLPQLVHHRDELLGVLLGGLRMEAALSLEPLLELTGTLARDLQQDFLPALPRVLDALADLVDEGLDREPEQLQHLFACLSLICKHLAKLLAGEQQLLGALRGTQRLRHHRAEHVRALAAEALGFLFRHASAPAIRVGVKAVLAEAAARPSDERLHAAGALLAEAALGVSHGLHSRASAVLGQMLREDILRPQDFKSAKSAQGGKLTAEQIQARLAAAASVCLQQLAEHTRRGKCGELWQLVLGEVEGRLDRLEAAQQAQQAPAAANGVGAKRGRKGSAAVGTAAGPSAGAAGAEGLAAAANSAARGVALLSQLVEHGRGCRVESYTPLFRLAARLARPEFVGGGGGGEAGSPAAGEAEGEAQAEALPYGASAVCADFLEPPLSAQVLRFLLALTLAHAKTAGASEGPAAIGKAAPQWAPVFARAPPAQLLAFIRAVITPPGGYDLARIFGQQMLGTLGRCLLAGQHRELCWPLLMDVCCTLRPGAAAGSAGVPVILTAAGVGPQLAALVRSTARMEAAVGGRGGGGGGEAAAAEAWAALACLPHASENATQAAVCCAALAAATEPAAAAAGGGGAAAAAEEEEEEQERAQEAGGVGGDGATTLMLHCRALAAHAELLGGGGAEGGGQVVQQLLPRALALLARHPRSFHAVSAAAGVLQAASAAGAQLGEQQLQQLAPLLAPNLSAASQPLRRETLRALCCFPMPAMLAPAGSEDAARGVPQPACDALQQLLALESRQRGSDGGRPAIVSLGRMRNYLEYRRLPDWMVPPVVHALLGVLHIRFAGLWNPAHDALATALDAYPKVAWPLILRQLAAAQEAFLAGDCQARPAEAAAAALAAAGGGAGASQQAPRALGPRFAAAAAGGEAAAVGGSTDAAVRLAHLLKALAAANNNVVESRARDWVPLFLAFTAASPSADEEGHSGDGAAGSPARAAAGAEDEQEEEEAEGEVEDGEGGDERQRSGGGGGGGLVSGRPYRAALREWLAMLGGLKGARGMFRWETVQRAVAVQLMDVDPTIQQGALKCLKVFKLKFLLPYLDRLLRLADNKTLREELTAFPLAARATSLREDEGKLALLAEHRAGVVPLLIRLLFPKMRKRSGRLGGKGAPGSARAAILNFLAAAEPGELRPLLELFLMPLSAAFVRPSGEAGEALLQQLVAQDDPDAHRLIEGPWWGRCLGRQPGAWWLAHVDAAALNGEPLRRRIGYLNTLEDLLKHLGHRMQVFLPELLALAVCLLEGGVQPLLVEAGAGDEAGAEAAEGAREVRGRSLRLVAAVLDRFPASCDYAFLWPRLLAAAQPLLPRLAAESAADKAPPLIELTAALAASPHLVPLLADGRTSAVPAAAGGGQPEAPAPAAEVAPCAEPWAAQRRLGSGLLACCVGALSAPRCSEPSRVAMLGALESLFDLADPLPQQVLGPHMPALLAGLQSIVVAVWQQGTGGGRAARGRKAPQRGKAGSGKPAGPRTATASRALAILELVGGRVASWEAAQQLTDALLPLLQPREGAGGRRRQGKGDEQLVARTLAVLGALWSRLPPAELHQRLAARQQLVAVAAALAPLAGNLQARDARLALCAAFTAVAGMLADLAEAARLLADLNAVSASEIDELDYGRRMAAYAALTPAAWQPLSQRQAAPLLHTCLHDLRNADQDAEVDFLLNAAHIQLHRRARALARLARLLRRGGEAQQQAPAALGLGTLVGVVQPLLLQMIVEGKGGAAEEGGHEQKQADLDRGANVTDAAVVALGVVAAALPWVQYQQLLGQHLRLVKKHADDDACKAIIRSVCVIIDAFHFPLPADVEEEGAAEPAPAAQPAAAAVDGEVAGEPAAEEEEEGEEEMAAAEAAAAAGEVYRMLSQRVVPELQRIMVDKETVRAPVALAVVKVLKLLPAAAMRLQLPRTLQKVANLLKHRMQSSRCGRAHLCRAGLGGRSRLGEASHPKTRTKLSMLLQHAARGVLANPTGEGPCLVQGRVARRPAAGSTPEDICMFFFATADAGLAAEEAARGKAKAAAGAAMPTGKGEGEGDGGSSAATAAMYQHLLVEFALSLLQGGLRKGTINPRSPGAGELLDPLLPLLVRALRSRHAPSVTTALQALSLLMQSQLPGLQKTAADAGKAVTELLKRCPQTSHPIAQDCFKLLGGMLRQCERWQPSTGQLRFLVTWAFGDLEESAGRQNAFHLLKAILSRKLVLPEVYDLMVRVQELMVRSQAAPVRSACSSALLQFLLDYPLGELAVLAVLVVVVVLLLVREAAAGAPPVPSGHLSYEHASGREAALDMLTVVLTKFPQPLVSQWAEMVFLPLVARLVNDPDSRCRSLVGAALGVVARRAGTPQRDRLAQYCVRWLGGGDARLSRAAAQALGVLAEAEGAGFARRVPPLLPPLANLLESRAAADAAAADAAGEAAAGEAGSGGGGGGEAPAAAAPGWQEAYYSLLLLQRLLEGSAAAQLGWGSGAAARRCWAAAQRLLLHRHQWVRKAAGRLVGGGLAAPAVGQPWLEAAGSGAAGTLALSFFRQLDSEAADEALAGQAVKCLVFLATHMYEDDEAAGRVPPPLKLAGPAAAGAAHAGEAAGAGAAGGAAAVGSSGEEEEEGAGGEEEEAEEDQDDCTEAAAAAADGSGSDGEDGEGAGAAGGEAAAAEEAAGGGLSLQGLVRRMARLADDKTYGRQLQRGVALRFVAAAAARLGAARVAPYLPLLMRPLYRITEPGATGNPPEVVSLAEEVVAHLRGLAGADAMLAAYNAARQSVRRQRGERKRREALQTLVDPEAAAKRKMRKQQRKAAGKRKQLDHVRRQRSAGVVVKNKRLRTEGGADRGGGGGGGRGRRG
ncbi:hypothetical protein CHLNCDRAFT_51116 [Chlorella variabilis]|uniref:Uncharacterized protein n=1 Tax=Chlorella variabilis TaxID=554065 RepID=E1Z9Q2_CHLVA|nr:hypothetical protein CHLNCDRAFT_51116 [Chlorella variabilis]EFN57812.1 hypothetical protein CHLNCDRAFT_51116 [Chlorella variabilis]|eukprot:XP_005849914.1 hypothetical protein CHLNCDRAFT_51116 [Chlorella variabilis]